jgi:hypothetical protein
MEWEEDGGYHLWIRKKPDIDSVLLTESTADPEQKMAVYALRTRTYNKINGDERRILNGEFLESERDMFFLVDSSPQPYEPFGRAFHVFIPYEVIYGYPDKRYGEIEVSAGTYLNIRTFERPYADYRGAFRDNPFILDYRQPEPEEKVAALPEPAEEPPEEPTPPPQEPPEEPPPEEPPPEEPAPDDRYDRDTVENFEEIAEEGKGTSVLSMGPEKLADEMGTILDATKGDRLDLVLALDTTQSMRDDIPHLRDSLVPLIKSHTDRFSEFRVGLVLYRDYMEQYLVKPYPFESSLAAIQETLNSIRVRGGRDTPEAVYEALYTAIHEFPWFADARMVILVGDAPAHPVPRGKITKERVYTDAESMGIELHTIILPH